MVSILFVWKPIQSGPLGIRRPQVGTDSGETPEARWWRRSPRRPYRYRIDDDAPLYTSVRPAGDTSGFEIDLTDRTDSQGFEPPSAGEGHTRA